MKSKEDIKKYQREWTHKNKERINEKLREKRDKLKKETGFDRPSNNKCLNCGKQCIKKYCSRKCVNDFKYKTTINKWLNHDIKGIRKHGKTKKGDIYYSPSTYIQKYMRNNYPECQQCGWSKIHPISGELLLEIHHKDGDRENGYLENLEHLCPNCHSQTNNYTNHGRTK